MYTTKRCIIPEILLFLTNIYTPQQHNTTITITITYNNLKNYNYDQ